MLRGPRLYRLVQSLPSWVRRATPDNYTSNSQIPQTSNRARPEIPESIEPNRTLTTAPQRTRRISRHEGAIILRIWHQCHERAKQTRFGVGVRGIRRGHRWPALPPRRGAGGPVSRTVRPIFSVYFSASAHDAILQGCAREIATPTKGTLRAVSLTTTNPARITRTLGAGANRRGEVRESRRRDRVLACVLPPESAPSLERRALLSAGLRTRSSRWNARSSRSPVLAWA